MPRLSIWTLVLWTSVLSFSVTWCQLQCSEQEPEIIFNGNLRLMFCNNTFNEFYNCLCHDNTLCIAPYRQANDGSYWSVLGINTANVGNTVDLTEMKHFRCRVPLFFTTGNLECNKFPFTDNEGTFIMNSTCEDGEDVTVSWEYEQDITLNNWASVLHEAVTMNTVSETSSQGIGQSSSDGINGGSDNDHTGSIVTSGLWQSTDDNDSEDERQGNSSSAASSGIGVEQSTSFAERASSNDNDDDDDNSLTPIIAGCTVAGYIFLVLTSSIVIVCRSRNRAGHSPRSEEKA